MEIKTKQYAVITYCPYLTNSENGKPLYKKSKQSQRWNFKK